MAQQRIGTSSQSRDAVADLVRSLPLTEARAAQRDDRGTPRHPPHHPFGRGMPKPEQVVQGMDTS